MENVNVDKPRSQEIQTGCSCQPHGGTSRQFIYSIGKLSIRFPTIGLEREFQQRERLMFTGEKSPVRLNERTANVLRKNQYLARSMCFVHSVSGIPAYIVVPAAPDVLDNLLTALEKASNDDAWVIVIGKRGNMVPPTACGGILAPYVLCDVVYEFRFEELFENLLKRIESVLKRKAWPKDKFKTVSHELFQRIVSTPDNLGALEGHRALNYILAQHPGPYLAAFEYGEHGLLYSVDTIPSEGAAGQKLIAVVMTFVDRNTGVPERVSTTVDVTEEWPFIVELGTTGAAPSGMVPYIETKSG
jgi:hypothetical protein